MTSEEEAQERALLIAQLDMLICLASLPELEPLKSVVPPAEPPQAIKRRTAEAIAQARKGRAA